MKIGGIPVVDATKSVTIHILKRDIETGNKKDAGGCAAALACKRKFSCKDARVHLGRVYIKDKDKDGDGDKWVRYHTPHSLRTEIIAFDRGGQFEPGDYVLQKVPGYDKIGQRKKSSNRWKRGPHIAKIKHPVRHMVAGVRRRGANI